MLLVIASCVDPGRGGLTITVETITVETIAVETVTVETINSQLKLLHEKAIASCVDPGGGIDDCCCEDQQLTLTFT